MHSMLTNIPLICNDAILSKKAALLRDKWGFSATKTEQFQLNLSANGLVLFDINEKQQNGIFVDFTSGKTAHRRKFGGGKNQSIAKAIGVKTGVSLSVIDANAGLGQDAFVLASLGCSVSLVERSPIVNALLDDGLDRAYLNAEIGPWVKERMQLYFDDALAYLKNNQADIVYLDPMFPHKKKSALVKKEMRTFQTLVGADLDADALLAEALKSARYRVVVKRPSYADFLGDKSPTMSIKTKNNRFDVYVKKAITKKPSLQV